MIKSSKMPRNVRTIFSVFYYNFLKPPTSLFTNGTQITPDVSVTNDVTDIYAINQMETISSLFLVNKKDATQI